MNQLEKLKAELELEISQNPIEKDEFLRWKDLKVTRRLYLELTKELMEEREAHIGVSSFDPNEIALRLAQKESVCEMLQTFLDWNPSEE
jgi:hypothetical protein